MAVSEKLCQANNLKPSKNVQSEKYQQNAKLLCQVFMNGVCSIFANLLVCARWCRPGRQDNHPRVAQLPV